MCVCTLFSTNTPSLNLLTSYTKSLTCRLNELSARFFKHVAELGHHISENTYYRQHYAQRKAPVFKLLRGRFWGFQPHRGDMLHLWGWNLAWRSGLGRSAKFHPQFTKILLNFRILTYSLHNFYEICSVRSTFRDVLAIKIWMDLLKGLQSYGGFKLRQSGFSQIFRAP